MCEEEGGVNVSKSERESRLILDDRLTSKALLSSSCFAIMLTLPSAIATAVGMTIVLLISLLCIYVLYTSTLSSWKPTVLLISFDGFGNDILLHKSPSLYPNLKALMNSGGRAMCTPCVCV